jgi:hypothetical protein
VTHLNLRIKIDILKLIQEHLLICILCWCWYWCWITGKKKVLYLAIYSNVIYGPFGMMKIKMKERKL